MKYIDAERLKTYVQARRDMHYNHYVKTGVGCIAEYKYDEDVELLDLIDSLRQEQESIVERFASLQQEQESIAEKFARIVRGNLIGIDKETQQKFENLYFEITGNKMYGGYND